MAFEKLEFEKVWTSAEDFPTYESDESQVRADMQYHPDALKDFINALIDGLAAQDAANALGAEDGGTASTVQSVLNNHADLLAGLAEDLATLAAGGVPTSSQSTSVSFTEESWYEAENEPVTLTIPRTDHKRGRSAFGYQIYQNGSSGTWGAATTRVTYDENTKDITLTAEAPFEGKIVFFGL